MKKRQGIVWAPVLIMVGVVVTAGISVFWLTKASKPIGRASVSLSAVSVSPGETLTITRTFVNRWPSNLRLDKIQIKNAQGQDMIIHTGADFAAQLETQLPSYGSQAPVTEYTAFQQAIIARGGTLSGFIEKNLYNGLLNYTRPGSFFIESSGCWIGIAETTEPPPSQSEEKTSFVILAGTPSGTYEVVIDQDDYCDLSGPSGTLKFTVN